MGKKKEEWPQRIKGEIKVQAHKLPKILFVHNSQIRKLHITQDISKSTLKSFVSDVRANSIQIILIEFE